MRTLVIGVGNEYRGDDAAGRLVARKLAETAPPAARVIESSGESAGLMESWQGYDRVYLIDAVESRKPPGTIHRLDAHRTELPREFFHCSTHAFSIAEAVELARSMELLPPEVVVFGIEGQWFEAGQRLTPAVENAIPQLVDRILKELNTNETQTQG